MLSLQVRLLDLIRPCGEWFSVSYPLVGLKIHSTWSKSFSVYYSSFPYHSTVKLNNFLLFGVPDINFLLKCSATKKCWWQLKFSYTWTVSSPHPYPCHHPAPMLLSVNARDLTRGNVACSSWRCYSLVQAHVHRMSTFVSSASRRGWNPSKLPSVMNGKELRKREVLAKSPDLN